MQQSLPSMIMTVPGYWHHGHRHHYCTSHTVSWAEVVVSLPVQDTTDSVSQTASRMGVTWKPSANSLFTVFCSGTTHRDMTWDHEISKKNDIPQDASFAICDRTSGGI